MTLPLVIAVDDERDILSMLSSALTAEGYQVRTAGTVAELRALDTDQAKVAIIDLSLPDGNGLALVKEFRRKGDCGIIILTGRSDETDQVLGLEIGADDYITKPFRLRELVARVNAVYRRAAAVAPASEAVEATAATVVIDCAFDGYKISSSARQVWGPDGAQIDLTTAEFEVLLVLMRRQGAVLGRDQIMAQIKGRDWVASERAVDGLVSRLRRKLPAVPPRTAPYIRTVHGFGYSLAI
jgi:two-component system torCAD operon response regulator TorR